LRDLEMGDFVATRGQRILGWAVTATMTIATVAMFVFS
jgi:Mn2+/Fe2+ NRAMP family transporter